MARSEARVTVDIWDDPDFRALTCSQQRAYLFLVSQRDLCHTGVIALRERRWARTAADLNSAVVIADLKALEAARFVVVDENTEEVLVRSLLRRDKVYRQPNVLRTAAGQVAQIESQAIRAVLLAELRRIAASGDVPAGSAAVFGEMVATLGGDPAPLPAAAGDDPGDPSPTPSGTPSPTPSGRGSGTPSAATPGDWGVVTAVSSDSPIPNPQAPSPVPPETPPASPERAGEPRGRRTPERLGTRIPEDFKITDEMASWAREHVPQLAGAGETERFIDYWKSKPGAAGRKTDWVATWRNWMRTAAERNHPQGQPGSQVKYRSPRRDNPFATTPAGGDQQ